MKKIYLCCFFLFFLDVKAVEGLIEHDRYEVISKPSDIKKIHKKLSKINNINIKDLDIKPLENSGIYYIEQNGSNYYISKDGNFLIKGLALKIKENKLEVYKEKKFQNEILLINKSDGIVYNNSEKNEKNIKKDLIVFVDYSCPFCKNFHTKTLSKLIDDGFRVQYLPVLKNYRNETVKRNMEYIFCKESNNERKIFLDRFFSDLNYKIEKPKDLNCDLSNYYHLTESLKIIGTPAVYTRSGIYLGGYQTFEEIKEKI